jgi:lysophospholipase L1-like esterase
MGASDGRQAERMPWRAGLRVLAVGGIALAAVAGFATTIGIVIIAEGLLARERLETTRLDSVLALSGTFGADRDGPPVALGMMGDSLAVGYGAESPSRVPGALIAEGLAEASGRPVVLTNVGEVGAESSALIAQLATLRRRASPDVVVVLVGANDVMHLKRLTDALWPLAETVRQLRRDGAQVVVATCPDLGTVHPFTQPLRFVAHWYSRVLATGQAIVVLRAGGRSVSLADTLGPLFRLDPEDLFSTRDHLHPSSVGYLAAAEVILPSVRVAAGFPIPGDEHVPHRIYRKGSHHPLAWWAFRASRRVGERLTAYESAIDVAHPA